jgi:hypothetical protein
LVELARWKAKRQPLVIDRRPRPETPWDRASREAAEKDAEEAAQKALEAAQ